MIQVTLQGKARNQGEIAHETSRRQVCDLFHVPVLAFVYFLNDGKNMHEHIEEYFWCSNESDFTLSFLQESNWLDNKKYAELIDGNKLRNII
jgi:SOS response regulatory protein OraA/RecX